jgi:glycerol uptake facilitator-like aquaporin
MFSDSFAGIAPASVLTFILAQLIGAALALAVLRLLYPADAGSAPASERASSEASLSVVSGTSQ